MTKEQKAAAKAASQAAERLARTLRAASRGSTYDAETLATIVRLEQQVTANAIAHLTHKLAGA